MKTIINFFTLSLLFISLLYGCDDYEPVPGETDVTVSLDSIGPFVPDSLIRGDREFNGNGPIINCSAELTISEDRKNLLAKIKFHAKETKPDWSETQGEWKDWVVYRAPEGKKIGRILSDKHSLLTDYENTIRGEFQLLAPEVTATLQVVLVNLFYEEYRRSISNSILEGVSEDIKWYEDNGNIVQAIPPGDITMSENELVKAFHFVADTGGPDISTDENPKDDTRLAKVVFNEARISLQPVEE